MMMMMVKFIRVGKKKEQRERGFKYVKKL